MQNTEYFTFLKAVVHLEWQFDIAIMAEGASIVTLHCEPIKNVAVRVIITLVKKHAHF